MSLKRWPNSLFVAVSFFALLLGFVSPQAQAQTEQILYSFSGATGQDPLAGLIMDGSGNLYGTTREGGANGYGAVFELVNSSGTYSEKVLHSFTPSNGDGADPYGGLIMDASGNLYGTTIGGGPGNGGTVFELVKSSGYSEQLLHSFTNSEGVGGADGADPVAALVMDGSGNLYGTTTYGGTNNYGTVFELVNSSGTYSENVLYNFPSEYPSDGGFVSSLIMDGSGNLYGTAQYGGTDNQGTVFELVNSSGGYSEKVLYSFTGGDFPGPDGAEPFAGLIMDVSGNLYGTTSFGGTVNGGIVFELVNASGTYSEKVLYNFPEEYTDDGGTISGLIMDGSGNLYGTTTDGGTDEDGAVYELANSSGTYSFTVLYSFAGWPADGANPFAGLIMDASGNLYGTTQYGGKFAGGGDGTVFELVNTSTLAAPSFTSANATSLQVGVAGSFTVTSSGSPTPALAESGPLPSGVTFTDNGNGTGTLGGTPVSATGTYPIVITATNAAGSVTQPFTLTVTQGLAITSGNMTTFTAGSTGFFSVTTIGSPTPALSESGNLPSLVTFTDNGNGTATLTGMPETGTDGSYPITIVASNGGVDPNATQSFTLVVDQGPAITTGNATTFTVGVAGTFTVTTTAYPTAAITESGPLPAGVKFTDNGNGTATLAGTPASDTGGSYLLTITANNGVSSPAMQVFLLAVNEGPAITSSNSTTFTEEVAGSFTVGTMGDPTPILTETGALPSGINFNYNGNGTATLSGTPASGSAGQYGFTIEASNGVPPNATQTFTLTVVRAVTSVSVTSSVNPSNFGEAVTFTVHVTPASSAVPTGTVTLLDAQPGGSIALKTATLPSSGTVNFKISTLNIGSHNIVAEYSGDANCGASGASLNSPQVVVPNAATTAITSSLNPAVFGEAVTFNVVVTPTSGTAVPTGTVVLSDGGAAIATLTLDVTGSASYSTSSLSAGTNTMTAAYSGDANFGASAATLKQVVSKVASTLTVTPSASTIPVGQSVTLDINVGPAFNSVVPTGTVTLKSAGTTLTSLTLDNTGSASFTTFTLPAGNDNITVSYSGDSNYNATTAKTPISVTKLPLTITLNPIQNPYTLGAAAPGITVIITVSAQGCCTVFPSGTITLKEGTTVLDAIPVLGAASSTYLPFVPLTTAGNFNITVTYSDDPNYANASAAVVEQVVKATPTVSLVGEANAYFMQPFTLTANVSGFVVPTGTVLIKDGSATIDKATLVSCPTCGYGTSQVSFTTTSLSVGTHNFTADYLGDANFLATVFSTLGPSTIMPAPITATLTSSLNPSTFGQAVTFTATIVGNYGGTPTGTVTFTDGFTTLKTIKLSGGTASYTTSSLSSTTHSISCSYSGDSNFLPGTCGSLTQTVQ